MRRQFQSAHCIHFKEERIGRFEGLPQNDLSEQDVIGEGLLKPFLSQKPGTRTEIWPGKSKQWLSRYHPLLKIPRFKDSRF